MSVSSTLSEHLSGASPLVLVPDRTRDAALQELWPQIAPLSPTGVLFASGTHRPMSEAEMRARVPDAALPLIAHDAERADFLPLSEHVRVNRLVVEADALLIVSEMRFHYLAGFGGGRKMIVPGVACERSARWFHAHSFSDGERPRGVRPGFLDDNPLHQVLVQLLKDAPLPPTAGLCVVNEGGRVVDLECGDLIGHHEKLAARFREARTVVVDAPVDRAEIHAGSPGYEVNLVQAHKALCAVAPVLEEGARVVLRARCHQGVGHDNFARWCAAPLEAQRRALMSDFAIGRQTAWSLRSLFDRFEVGLVSELDDEVVCAMGARPLDDDGARAFVGEGALVAARGASALYVLKGA